MNSWIIRRNNKRFTVSRRPSGETFNVQEDHDTHPHLCKTSRCVLNYIRYRR